MSKILLQTEVHCFKTKNLCVCISSLFFCNCRSHANFSSDAMKTQQNEEHPIGTANLKKLLLIAADNGLCSLGVWLIMFGYKHNIQPENQQQPKSYWTDKNSTSFV